MTIKKGRPKKIVPTEVIQNILYRFEKEHNLSGKITYMDVYRFSKELFKKGEIEYDLGEFFWRKGEGRAAIDKVNQVLQHSIPTASDESESYIDTKDAMNKFFTGKSKDKEKLLGLMLINEKKLKQSIRKCQQLQKELVEAKDRLDKEITKNAQLENERFAYQEALFQWMELSMSRSTPIKNLMTVGESRSAETTKLLSDIFSLDPLQTFQNMQRIMSSKSPNQGEVLEFNPSRSKKKSVLDDIDF